MSASDWVSDESAMDMTGWAPGSNRCRIGSRISVGSLWRTVAIALRTSSEASTMFLANWKTMMMRAWLSVAVERIS